MDISGDTKVVPEVQMSYLNGSSAWRYGADQGRVYHHTWSSNISVVRPVSSWGPRECVEFSLKEGWMALMVRTGHVYKILKKREFRDLSLSLLHEHPKDCVDKSTST